MSAPSRFRDGDFGGPWPPPLGYSARMSNTPAGLYADQSMLATLFFCDDTVWSQTAMEPMHPVVHVEGGDG